MKTRIIAQRTICMHGVEYAYGPDSLLSVCCEDKETHALKPLPSGDRFLESAIHNLWHNDLHNIPECIQRRA